MIDSRRSPYVATVVAGICAVLVAVFAPAVAVGQPVGDYWVSSAQTPRLDDPDMARLKRDGILVTNVQYKQVFTPYLTPSFPIFVTSDSLLNAYHVLYEESIRRLEQANAKKLPEVLRFILANLDGVEGRVQGEPQLVSAARRRALIVVGTALRLLDPAYEPADESLCSIIEQEVDRVVAAQTRAKPAWLGPPEEDFLGLDYNRYKVRGFYERNESLSRYFRAAAWLQSIPFRVAKDEEFLSILMLGSCITRDRFGPDDARYREYRDFFSTYRVFIGAGDDWDLTVAADHVRKGTSINLKDVRRRLLKEAAANGNRPQINDQLRFAPDDPNLAAEANFRIISAYRTPDAVLFQRTADIRQFERGIPNGLEVCAALGSTFARDRIEDKEKAKLLKTIDECKPLFTGSGLYLDYMNTVAALLDAPEPNAPAFMKGEAWQAKSCAAALGGWAQLRHTWVLQAKSAASYAGKVIALELPRRLVEPEPEFYRRLAILAAGTQEALKGAHAFDADYSEAIDALMEAIGLLEESEGEEMIRQKTESLQRENRGRVAAIIYRVSGYERDWQARVARLRRVADDLKAGRVDPAFEDVLNAGNPGLEPLWRSLVLTSHRLESIARRQLSRTNLDPSDERFLGTYGSTLAAIMFYRGNSYLTPRDDAPRIADVYWHWTRGSVHVGIGRLRLMYVLYPWKGTDILCRGAIVPYYEFLHKGRLTDAEWKSMLDGDARPGLPSWYRPIIQDGNADGP